MTFEQIRKKLGDPEYRRAFVGSQININLPFQIRALLRQRPGWTQETLAQKTGMRQPRVSALMTPGKTRPNIETLRRIAEAFDCGLAVRFVPFSELARWSCNFDPESFQVPPFDGDSGFLDRKEPQAAAASSGPIDADEITQAGSCQTAAGMGLRTAGGISILTRNRAGGGAAWQAQSTSAAG
jgi:transcriptional regulator with XRE-family HTH domain